ncbi:MAG: AURKAIP1/COX24 domain-containing protein [Nocardiopsaceae bacterium]|nr:AURKAIP1/COX24 domain-containing protein [Nocardiopsaceae bacterium]
MGSVVKKRRKRMAKKKHRKMLKRTRIARRSKK